MKKQVFVLLAIVSATFTGLSQDCSAFYPFEEGAMAEITTYDKRDNVAAKVTYVVSRVSQNGGAITAEMNVDMKDGDGELITQSAYDVHCNNDGIEIDFKSMFSTQMATQFSDMETEITGTNIVLPNDLSVGQTLPDATMEAQINMSGINMNMSVMMTDRKVTAQESITTPAGTFDCYVLEYTNTIKMGVNQRGSAKQWIAKGVGLVKQEDYNRRGKVTSSSLLTDFSR
jgi:hypothetical protein